MIWTPDATQSRDEWSSLVIKTTKYLTIIQEKKTWKYNIKSCKYLITVHNNRHEFQREDRNNEKKKHDSKHRTNLSQNYNKRQENSGFD